MEADLISIAHRILQLKNKSDINQLYLETQKLYEKLSVLRFVDEYLGDIKPTIGLAAIEKEIDLVYYKEELSQTAPSKVNNEIITEEITEVPAQHTSENKEVSQPIKSLTPEEILAEEVIESPIADFEETEEMLTDGETVTEEKEIPAEPVSTFKPAFELTKEKEPAEIETPKKTGPVQISFEDLLGGNYSEPQFVKAHPFEKIPPTIAINFEEKQPAVIEEIKTESFEETKTEPVAEIKPESVEPKTVPLNEKLAKGINIDLNDRIAFIKHLFGNSSEDYNRVLNQLITFDTFYETRDFIQEMVKPDYNNWQGKQDYEERFMDIIEKKFL